MAFLGPLTRYMHYLTKWAFALNRMSLARSDPKYNSWGVQASISCPATAGCAQTPAGWTC